MRKALVVGINYYDRQTRLHGCVDDAQSVARLLARNDDRTNNFTTPKLLVAKDSGSAIDNRQLREHLVSLFSDDSDIALFYFAGHGCVDESGGFLCSSNSLDASDSVHLSDVMTFARESKARNRIVILDSCHGGIAGDRAGGGGVAEIVEGMTLLTASTEDQHAFERGTGGVFTSLLVDALGGAAANLVGDVTPGSVYAHIDQSLGPWGGQRPMFKTHVKRFVSLRKAKPPIAFDELKQLADHFPQAGYNFRLDPSFEPERNPSQADLPPPNPANTAIFRVLQNYVKVNLVRPVDAPHMWHAAMGSKSCRLTVLGEHHRRLVAENLI